MIYSVSHNDLDGYTSQFFVYTAYSHKEVTCFNVNYGKELTSCLEEISKKILPTDKIVITDLNLTMEQASFVDSFPCEKLLLDHHAMGKSVADVYPWYILDSTICATAITFKHFNIDKKYILLKDIVNAYDLWIEDSPLLIKGKVFNQLLRESIFFPKVLPDLKRNYIFTVLSSGFENKDHIEIESELYSFNRNFFDPQEDFSRDPLFIIRIRYMYNILKENMIYFTQDGYKGVVFQGLSDIFQEFSHMLLLEFKDIDFAVNISSQGHMSFRTIKDTVKLDDLCRKYWNGGGHPKASGGTLQVDDKPLKLKDNQLIAHFLERIV